MRRARRWASSATPTPRPSAPCSRAAGPRARPSANDCNGRSDGCAAPGGRDMTQPEPLLTRARRAFRRGRAVKALGTALLAVPLVGASFAACAGVPWSLGAGLTLAAALFAMVYRGGIAGRAVGPGLLAGSATLAIPLIAARFLDGAPALAACLVAGLASAALVLWLASGPRAAWAPGLPLLAPPPPLPPHPPAPP